MTAPTVTTDQFLGTLFAEGSTINARDVITIPATALREGLPRRLNMKFDDGTVIETTGKEVYFSWFFWVIYKKYPKAPLLPRHHVKAVLKGEPLNAGTAPALAENIVRDLTAAYDFSDPKDWEIINRYVYRNTCQDVYNDMISTAERYVAPIDLVDIIELARHPVIEDARNRVTPHAASIERLEKTIMHVIRTDPDIQNNALVKAVRSKIVNFQQVCQCIGVRGFPTEVDGRIFKKPIMSNYVRGLSTMYDYASDSRGAPKALYNTETPLQDAEYFARRLQLLCMVVEGISRTDCGTTQYLPWILQGPKEDDHGKVVYPGDLPFMIGKFYKDEESGKLKELDGSETHLYGKYIQMRSVLKCQHSNPHEVCQVCFGGLSRNVSRFSNLGHLCAATMTQQTSQSVLSTKHLVASGIGAPIILTQLTTRYFRLTEHKDAYIFLEELKTMDLKVVVPRDEALGLTDIVKIEDLADISTEKISSITAVDLVTTRKGAVHTDPIFLEQGQRKASFTTDAIEYLKAQYLKDERWNYDDRNNFVFDLKEWDYSKPFFTLPQKEYSFSEHSHEIAAMIESSMKNIGDREKPDSPMKTLQEIFTLVNSKLSVNLVSLEVIIYASMIPERNNYSLARGAPNPILGVGKRIIPNRSLGGAYAYERLKVLITNPRSFIPRNRPNSIFDVFVTPKQVVDELKRNNK